MGRLLHIQNRLLNSDDEIAHTNMIKRFQQDFESQKDWKWFFDETPGSTGGFYITSNIYMTCLLFYWTRRIQFECPYIPLHLEYTDDNIYRQYQKYCQENPFLSLIEQECSLHDFVKNIRVVLSSKYGISYGLHNSFGDYIFKYTENRIMNYAEFCEELQDANKRLKYHSIIQFWQGIVPPSEMITQERLKKIDMLIVLAQLLDKSSIRFHAEEIL